MLRIPKNPIVVATTLLLLLVLTIQGCVQKKNGDMVAYDDLFNGKDLTNWSGDEPFWRVEQGILIGEITDSTRIDANRFLIYQGELPGDFELIVDFKVSEFGNSGINYRSQLIHNLPYNALRGYQFDIDGKMRYTGSNYEEKRRSTLASIGESVVTLRVPIEDSIAYKEHNLWSKRRISPLQDSVSVLKSNFHQGDWNQARIVAKGNVLEHYLNDMLMSKTIDNDTVNSRFQGKLGVQVHIGPTMEIAYKSIKIRPL